MPPHRCIDGGAGADGCPPRLWFEVLGRDRTWRLAVTADEGGSFGLRGAVAHDAVLHGRFAAEVADGLSVVGARAHVDADAAAHVRGVRGRREFWVSQDPGSSPPVWVEPNDRPVVLGSRLALPRAESSPGLLDVLFGEEKWNGRYG